MRALITGGAGFVGANLVHRLMADGVEIKIIDNFSTGSANLVSRDVQIIRGDILDLDFVKKSMVGVDTVIHLAAYGSVMDSIADPVCMCFKRQ